MRIFYLVLLALVSAEKSLQNAEGIMCGRACYYLIENMFEDLSDKINEVVSSKSKYEQQMSVRKSKIRSFEKCYEKISYEIALEVLESRLGWEKYPYLARPDYSELKYLKDYTMNSEMLQFFEVSKSYDKKSINKVPKHKKRVQRKVEL